MDIATYYNDNEPFAAAWLRGLVDRSFLPQGHVDARSIEEVQPADIVGYRQCHWFAGIGGWPLAVRLAGLEFIRRLWTASLPCQPLSVAGRKRGAKDQRHLWPEFYRLVAECLPSIIVGEQSASKDGRLWLDGISLDLEELGYAVAAADLPAAGVGAPHRRQRFYWGAVRLADAQHDAGRAQHVGESRRRETQAAHTAERGRASAMADTSGQNGRTGVSGEKTGTRSEAIGRERPPSDGTTRRLGDSESDNKRRSEQSGTGFPAGVAAGGSGSGLGDTMCSGLEGLGRAGEVRDESGWQSAEPIRSVGEAGVWDDYWLAQCVDGRQRRVGAGIHVLASGIPFRTNDPELVQLLAGLRGVGVSPEDSAAVLRAARRNRIGRLKGYGNAIVPQLAAVFLRSLFDSIRLMKQE